MYGLELLKLFFQFISFPDELFAGDFLLRFKLEGPFVGIDDSLRIDNLGEEIEREMVVPGGFEFVMGVESLETGFAYPDPVIAVPVERNRHR